MPTFKRLFPFIPFILLQIHVDSVDRSNFKTCDQSGFCKRHRNIQPGHSPYHVDMNSFKVDSTHIEGVIVNTQTGVTLKLDLFALKDNMLRMKLNELNSVKQRFEAKEALLGEPEVSNLEVESQDNEKMIIKFGSNKAILNASPFRLDIFSDDQLVISANARGLLKFEQYRLKTEQKSAEDEQNQNVAQQQPPLSPEDEQFKDTLWEESFKGHTDSKPYGPASVGMDFSFVGFNHVYGIPEHGDVFPLRNTKGSTDPYRLYNLDVFEYELNNPMALYGSIPFMVAHSDIQTVGLFWLNAAETWVDIEESSNQGVVSSIVDFVKGNTQIPQEDTHWFSESGIIDVFFLLGPKPKDVMFQYSKLTGTNPLPPLFSLAYHQCRWNYRDQDDVRNVDAGFDEHDIPYDVLWLDLDHTHDRKYFTWDPFKFSDPIGMLNNLTAKGRKMVTLVDPHIKRDNNYYIHKEATEKGLYVKNKDGQDYEGWCWPGSSGYLDFLSPEVRDWWASKYALDQYQGSTLSLFTWNDMNEPSVFNEPEVTMAKDAKHVGGWEHRDVHNMYGMLMVMATYKGHLMRNPTQRPFILSRSVFAGSQRYGAVWTGDNIADWNHLQISIPMILSLSISGLSFSGADVGGFFRNPSPELMLRWYQAGAYQPFFRAHSHHETRRREPWLFDQEYKTLIRDAIKERYTLLPLWYTLFHENERTGVPPMRPVWMEFPTETPTFDMNDEYMIGSSLLVKPVLETGATSVNVYFPGGSDEIWYDVKTHQKYEGGQNVAIPVDLSKIPVFQRGGTIISKKGRIRRSSSLTYNDPYTLEVALDKTGSHANGTLFIDDFNSFEYRNGNYLLLDFTFDKKSMQSKIIEGPGKFKTNAWLEKIIVIGLQSPPKSLKLSTKSIKSSELIFYYDETKQLLTIRKPGVNMGEEWIIAF